MVSNWVSFISVVLYGVNVTRVNRSGMDIFASRNLTLQVGDRVMVVGPQMRWNVLPI